MNSRVLTGIVILGLFSGLAFADPTQNPLINHQFPPVVTPTPAMPNQIHVGNDNNGDITGNGVNTNGTANNPAEINNGGVNPGPGK
jgi:hypothetical protein